MGQSIHIRGEASTKAPCSKAAPSNIAQALGAQGSCHTSTHPRNSLSLMHIVFLINNTMIHHAVYLVPTHVCWYTGQLAPPSAQSPTRPCLLK